MEGEAVWLWKLRSLFGNPGDEHRRFFCFAGLGGRDPDFLSRGDTRDVLIKTYEPTPPSY